MSSSTHSVLILTQHFYPETGAGPTRWGELTKRWADETEVTVITSAPDYPEGKLYDGYNNEWIRREEYGEVSVLYTKTIPASSGNLLRRSLKFVWFMLLALVVGLIYTSPNAVIATSPQPLTGVSGWIIARSKGGSFIYEVRDLWPETILAVSDFDNRVGIWFLDSVIDFLYRRSDILVVVSEAFTDSIVSRGIDQRKIVYHPNSIDPSFYQVESQLPEILPDLNDSFTVIYVGTIGRTHGLEIIPDIAPKLAEIQFVIVGDGAERERIEQLASDFDNIRFVGRRPKNEVPHFLASADVALVHLKPRDVFKTVIPSKLLEGMAAGLPIVLGVQGEAERILTTADAGIPIEPNNRNQLVEAIKYLRANPEERLRLGENGREYVSDEFNWNTIASEYLGDIRKSNSNSLSTR